MKNYYLKLSEIENEVCAELLELLGKIGAINIDDDKYYFFNFSTVCDLEIDEITKEGLVASGYQKGNSIRELVNSNTLPLTDVISLVDELRLLV